MAVIKGAWASFVTVMCLEPHKARHCPPRLQAAVRQAAMGAVRSGHWGCGGITPGWAVRCSCLFTTIATINIGPFVNGMLRCYVGIQLSAGRASPRIRTARTVVGKGCPIRYGNRKSVGIRYGLRLPEERLLQVRVVTSGCEGSSG